MSGSPMTPERFAGTLDGIRKEVGKVIVGQDDLVTAVIFAVLCEGHVLEGVPGLGKTRLLTTLGQALDVSLAGSSSPPT